MKTKHNFEKKKLFCENLEICTRAKMQNRGSIVNGLSITVSGAGLQGMNQLSGISIQYIGQYRLLSYNAFMYVVKELGHLGVVLGIGPKIWNR